MYKRKQPTKTTIEWNESYEGESLEEKIQRITNNKEPITDGAPLIYTNRKDGILPEYNPRTDRFEIAIDAMDKVTKNHLAKREERHKPIEDKATETQKIDKVEPTQATTT